MVEGLAGAHPLLGRRRSAPLLPSPPPARPAPLRSGRPAAASSSSNSISAPVENGAFGKAPMPGAAAPVAQQRRALGDLFNGAVARKVRRRAQPPRSRRSRAQRAFTRARVRARRERARPLPGRRSRQRRAARGRRIAAAAP